MKHMIRCCNCDKTYSFSLFKGALSLPIIECPHCSFRHTVEFKAIKDDSLLVQIPEIRLTTGPPVYSSARFFRYDSTDTGPPGRIALADDGVSITDWPKTSEIILVVQGDMVKGPWTAQYGLRWRNETTNPSGAFTALAATGEIRWGTNTGLVNGSAITSQWCATVPGGSAWQNGEQVEGAYACDSIVWEDEYYIDIAWALNPGSAIAGNTYTFEFYETTNSTSISTVTPTLTIASEVLNRVDHVIINM